MANLLARTYIIILTGIVFFFISCSKPKPEPIVIIPTVNPIPYSVLVYLITPTDKSFNENHYKSVKSCALSLQNWFKSQMGNNKTFVLNPVVVDTLTGLHNASWYYSNNGPAISGNGSIHAYYNTLYEMQQLLGANFSTTTFTYFVYVASDFPDETIPRGLAALGSGNLTGLSGQSPNSWIGAGGHALAHAFGLPEPSGYRNPLSLMTSGYFEYPKCILLPAHKDTLNASPFFKQQ